MSDSGPPPAQSIRRAFSSTALRSRLTTPTPRPSRRNNRPSTNAATSRPSCRNGNEPCRRQPCHALRLRNAVARRGGILAGAEDEVLVRAPDVVVGGDIAAQPEAVVEPANVEAAGESRIRWRTGRGD